MSDAGPVLFDISPPLGPDTAVFPGDTPLEREVLLDGSAGDSITLSTLRATCHLGAHIDAPIHYDPDGEPIGVREIRRFLGPCRVVRPAVERGGLVTVDSLRAAFEGMPAAPAGARPDVPKILISTGTYPDPRSFNPDFAALDPGLVDWLGEEEVQMIGVDTPSVDPADSSDLPAHAAARRHDMDLLEGLVLEHVPPGRYELIALPLRLMEFDGSPVRAVLRAESPSAAQPD